MDINQSLLNRIDAAITAWMQEHAVRFLRVSIGIVFVWFGFLKIIGYSPAAELVTKTVFWFNPVWFVPFLGAWEVIIGLCFLYAPFIRFGIFLLAPQMAGTFLPLILLPEITFQGNYFMPTLEGQYIIKNLVLISAAIAIGAHVRDKQRSAK